MLKKSRKAFRIFSIWSSQFFVTLAICALLFEVFFEGPQISTLVEEIVPRNRIASPVDNSRSNTINNESRDINQTRESVDVLLNYLPPSEQIAEEAPFPIETASFFSGVLIAILIGTTRHRMNKRTALEYRETDRSDQ